MLKVIKGESMKCKVLSYIKGMFMKLRNKLHTKKDPEYLTQQEINELRCEYKYQIGLLIKNDCVDFVISFKEFVNRQVRL